MRPLSSFVNSSS